MNACKRLLVSALNHHCFRDFWTCVMPLICCCILELHTVSCCFVDAVWKAVMSVFVFLAQQLVQRVSCYCALLCVFMPAHSAGTQTYMHRLFHNLFSLLLLCSLSLCVFFLSLFYLNSGFSYCTFMQPDTGSCFILDTDPPTPLLSSSMCALASGLLGKSTNMLNRIWL